MAGGLLLGIDLGATSLKATVVDGSGRVRGEASAPVQTCSPRPTWSEQDPADWWAALQQAVPAALAAAGAKGADIAAIGPSGGAHIAVLEDRGGHVIRPAILWSDLRSAAEAQELHAEFGDVIVDRSLNRANPTWTLPQLLWLKRHEPDAFARIARLSLAKDWLRARLTGDWTSDFSDAVGALMADRATRGWSEELAALVGLLPAVLPPLRRPTDIAGQVTAEAAAATSLAPGTPVVVGSNDTTVELFGVGATRAGDGAIKLATAGVVFLAVDRPEVHPPVSCYPHLLDGMWYMASGINACAAAHRWVRERFFPDLPAETAVDQMDRLAAGVASGSDGLIFHPYLLGERAPHWDPKLRGDFLGMTLRHERAHFARACYEGIAFALNDALRAMQELSGARFGAVRILGGGARSATWRQIVADVTGLTVLRPENADASFGAALVAGVGAGVFASPDEAIDRCVRTTDRSEPDPSAHARYTELFRIYDEAREKLTAIDHRLHDLFRN